MEFYTDVLRGEVSQMFCASSLINDNGNKTLYYIALLVKFSANQVQHTYRVENIYSQNAGDPFEKSQRCE